MNLMAVATRAVLLPLDAFRVQASVLGGEVVPVLTIVARQDDLIAWHFLTRIFEIV
jgi:hypothetical protein